MKKIVLKLCIATSFLVISCKESTKKEVNSEMNEVKAEINELGNNIEKGYENIKADVSKAFEDIKIPEFEDEKAEAYLNDYADHIKAKMNAGVENVKNSELAKETTEFANRSKEIVKNLDDKARKQFNETKAKIDAKWNEWEREAKAEINNN